MKKIIVADDEARIRRLVCDFLSSEGYEPIEANDGDVALEIFEKNDDIAALILDVMMPNVDGWEVCRRIRKTSNVPILMLTARSEEFDELMGFEVGADDYVTKPFSPSVLMKRVAALLRRTGAEADTDSAIPGLDGLTVDETAHVVLLDGVALEVTLKEYNILLKLLASIGRVFSREQLLDDIWGYDSDSDTHTVDVHIGRLRERFKDNKDFKIVTMRGIGYKVVKL